MTRSRKTKTNIDIDHAALNSYELTGLSEIQERANREFKANRKAERANITLARRMGRAALTGTAFGVAFVETATLMARDSISSRAGSKNKQTRKEVRVPDSSQYSRVGRWALNHWDKRVNRKEAKQKVAMDRVVEQYHTEHPEIRVNEEKRADVAAVAHKERALKTAGISRLNIVKSFHEQDAQKFVGAIPKRAVANVNVGAPAASSYFDMAKTTLEATLGLPQAGNGKIDLLSSSNQAAQVRELRKDSMDFMPIGKVVAENNAEVAALLWQTGFIDCETDQYGIPRTGEFNEAIEWENLDNMAIARIPYDETNDLHVMLGDVTASTDSRQFVEVQIYQGDDTYGAMSVGVGTEMAHARAA